MINLKILPASYGDCFLITIREENSVTNILIDGGLSKTYDDHLKQLLKELSEKGEKLSLIINTHIDSDHIRGLISLFRENNSKKYIEIDEIWFNGLEQIIQNDPSHTAELDTIDEEIINTIIKKGYEDEFQEKEEISAKEGVSLSGLIDFGKYSHNKVNSGKAITDSLDKIQLSENISIKIVNPNMDKLSKLELEWLEELDKKNFHFSIPKNQQLVTSFEFLISRLKTNYKSFQSKISSVDDIELYLSDLSNKDSSTVNESSISFVLEVYDKKFLFLGDAIIKNKNNCSIIKNLIEEYGENLCFDLIKVPHHGSNYNITKDFIDMFNAKEYIFSTNSEKFGHPDLDVLANLIVRKEEKTFIFNYPIEQAKKIDKENLKEKYQYKVIIGNGNEIIERRY
ncbi:MAG: MBL fold metallo-hydrolase [Psychrilyobacter sp.]|uniref:MBL fold metallo-hydrolase n=1 Tax=Psychrilyobacter sp. TaxID=2586924 RepID=UPI003C7960B7